MLIKLLNLFLLSLLSISPLYAEETPLAVYDLKIFDYKVGMTYDEAISARGFHYTVYPEDNNPIGIINSAYIEEVEFKISVYFRDNILHKIIARFDPQHIEKIMQSLQKVLGEGEDTSKTFNAGNGTVIAQHIYRWSYPGATIHLISLSNNAEFATLSMLSASTAEIDHQP